MRTSSAIGSSRGLARESLERRKRQREAAHFALREGAAHEAMDSTLREAYEPRVWDFNPSPACAKPVSVDALFPSAGKWFLEAETRPPQAGPRGRPFGLSGRAFSLPAGKPTGNDGNSSEVWLRVEFRTNGWWGR